MKEAVNEEHEGRRKNELTWKINRIHWEKNRFIYDLMYSRKARPSPPLEPRSIAARALFSYGRECLQSAMSPDGS